MPTFKHPCRHCGKWIERDVRACPYCGTADPFVAGRCPQCRTPIDDPAWIACPKCGTALKAASPSPGATTPSVTPPPAPEPRRCSGCGAPLADGARFCTVCGTLVQQG